MARLNLLDHPISFAAPLRIAPSAWITHVPFGMFLIDLLRPAVIVELGSHYGTSYCAFCQAIRELGLNARAYAIDTWKGDEHSGFYGEEVLADLRKHHDPLYGEFSSLIRSTFDEAVNYFPDASIDLLHIDGLHTYEAVKHDFESWLPKLSNRAVVVFHDINVRERDFGVWQLWEELAAAHPSFSVAHGHGLGVVAIGEHYPPGLNTLVEPPEEELIRIRELFFQLGKGVEAQLERDETQKALEARTAQVIELEWRLQAQLAEDQETNARLAALTAQLAERDQLIAEKDQVVAARTQEVHALLSELTQIQNTTTFKVYRRYHRVLDRFLPPGTRRRAFYDRSMIALRVLAKEGVRGVWTRLRTIRSIPAARILTPASVWLPAESMTDDLHFAEHASPDLSIVIVASQLETLRRCLASLAAHPSLHKFEVLVVDDATPGPTATALAQVTGIRILRNDRRQGFAVSCNAAAEVAHGRYLLFLRDRVVLQPECLNELVLTAENRPDIGLIGAKLLAPDGLLWEAGCVLDEERRLERRGAGCDPHEPSLNFLQRVDACTGAILVSKPIFDRVGGFDTGLDAQAEANLALSLSQRGLHNYYQPLACAVMFPPSPADNAGEKSLPDKWNEDSASRQKPFRAGKVLYIDTFTPTPDQDAGSMDAFNHMRILGSLGYQVTFAPAAALEVVPQYTADLQRIGVECLYMPYIESIEKHLVEHGNEYDIVILTRVNNAANFMHIVRQYCSHARVIFSTVDLHHLREMRQAEVEHSEELRIRARETRRIELDTMKNSDCTLVVSSAEKEMLQDELPGVNIVHIPLIVDIRDRKPVPFTERKDICFVGGFRHLPNADAMRYFIDEIWPLIRERIPDAHFNMIGSHMPKELLEETSAGIVAVGYRPDISEYLNTCRLSVAPLRFGAGLKGKVIHSLGYGLPAVVTSIASEGSGLVNGRDILVADAPGAFAEAVVRLYTDQDLWQQLAQNGLAFFEEKYSLTAGQRNFSKMIHELDQRAATRSARLLPVVKVASLAEYEAHEKSMTAEYARRAGVEAALIGSPTGFTTAGYCYVCGKPVNFFSDFSYALQDSTGKPAPNWRERMVCPSCGLNNRMRAAIHLFEQICRPGMGDAIYLTEQKTPLYKWFGDVYRNVTGSEYFGDRLPFGKMDATGIRNETLTDLTFSDCQFGHILTFDVFEHIPDYELALRECLRCLQPGGNLVFTVPFARNSNSNIVRARVSSQGEIEHILPPEYHGDPLNAQGVLCFYHFGWELLDQLRSCGFSSAAAYFYWSSEYGYLGHDQMIFIARKPL